MGDDDLVLMALALLWRLVDSLLWGLGLLLLGLLPVVIAAALIIWAGHALPVRRARPAAAPVAPDAEVLDLGPDPLDPRGDGVLRPGDPLFDALMGDEPVALLARRRDDGRWDVHRSPALPEPTSDDDPRPDPDRTR